MNGEINEMLESDSSTATTRSSWKFGLTGWILVFGLIMLVVGFLVETMDWDKRTFGWLIYRIDPRYWPVWPIPLLWGIVAWMLNDIFKNRFERIRRNQRRIKVGIIIGVFCWLAWLNGWTLSWLRRRIYDQLYVAYIMGPISIYIADGTWSWKLLISPILAVITIAFLLYIARQQRRKRNVSQSHTDQSGETIG